MPCSLDLSEDFRLPFLTSYSPSDRLPRFVREHSRLFRLRHRFAGLAPFHVEQPCRKVGPLSSGFYFIEHFSSDFFRFVTYSGITSRYIPLYSWRFLRRIALLRSSPFYPETFYGFRVLSFYSLRILRCIISIQSVHLAHFFSFLLHFFSITE